MHALEHNQSVMHPRWYRSQQPIIRANRGQTPGHRDASQVANRNALMHGAKPYTCVHVAGSKFNAAVSSMHGVVFLRCPHDSQSRAAEAAADVVNKRAAAVLRLCPFSRHLFAPPGQSRAVPLYCPHSSWLLYARCCRQWHALARGCCVQTATSCLPVLRNSECGLQELVASMLRPACMQHSRSPCNLTSVVLLTSSPLLDAPNRSLPKVPC
jgi:hypothetical protein